MSLSDVLPQVLPFIGPEDYFNLKASSTTTKKAVEASGNISNFLKKWRQMIPPLIGLENGNFVNKFLKSYYCQNNSPLFSVSISTDSLSRIHFYQNQEGFLTSGKVERSKLKETIYPLKNIKQILAPSQKTVIFLTEQGEVSFFASQKQRLYFRKKKIVQIATTPTQTYGLEISGKIYFRNNKKRVYFKGLEALQIASGSDSLLVLTKERKIKKIYPENTKECSFDFGKVIEVFGNFMWQGVVSEIGEVFLLNKEDKWEKLDVKEPILRTKVNFSEIFLQGISNFYHFSSLPQNLQKIASAS